MNEAINGIFSGLAFVGVIFLYFLPSFMARGKKHYSGIEILNIFLGWTGLGWVLALIWAVSDEDKPKTT